MSVWEIVGLLGLALWAATTLTVLVALVLSGLARVLEGSGPWVRFRRWLVLTRMVRAYRRASRQQPGNSGTFLP